MNDVVHDMRGWWVRLENVGIFGPYMTQQAALWDLSAWTVFELPAAGTASLTQEARRWGSFTTILTPTM